MNRTAASFEKFCCRDEKCTFLGGRWERADLERRELDKGFWEAATSPRLERGSEGSGAQEKREPR